MKETEITTAELNAEKFIQQKIAEIKEQVGDDKAINALSGGVDSSAVTMLGHQALGDQLRTVLIDNGLMRRNEPEGVAAIFTKLGVPVEVVRAKYKFFKALAGIEDPEEKREAITGTFYKEVFGQLVRETGAKFLLQGTNYTDVEETVAGIKRQHNILEQIGIDPEKAFGYKIIEPLVQLRKDGIRIIGKELGLPEWLFNRPPFPGTALATRVIGEVTFKEIEIVRQATAVMEEVLVDVDYFQVMAILLKDRVTGIVNGKRAFGRVIQLRLWDSIDARTATPTRISLDIEQILNDRIIAGVPGVVQVTKNLTSKPSLTMEAL